jgi:8-oxo-dGTP pyrophosphatase MutT (NUDIX family)
MTLSNYKTTFLAELAHYAPYDELEASYLQRTLDLLNAEVEPFSRSTLVGHITASAVLIDDDKSMIAMIWHEKLQRWFQPGGHCETDDQSVVAAALRELVEETGISEDKIRLLQETPFDIDVHPIPARGEEPAHFHYDIRYLFQSERHHLIDDGVSCQWRSVAEVAQMDDPSRSRFGAKVLRLKEPRN